MTSVDPRTPSTDARLPEGTRLAHYVIQGVLGEGAMGRVYRAHDAALDRPVAIKVLRPEVADDAQTVERFAQESRAAARVNHPNLTHVYYVGVQDGLRFFAMELLAGEDLEKVVKEQGPMDLDDALDMLAQAADGMAAAHRAGIVHRDLKPSNLIRRPDGRLKITDFGLAKSLDAEVGSTQAGQVLGTPTYMSPEQCRGRLVDPRSDIYALGLVAWTLLTGRVPFPGPAMGQVIHDQINTPLPSLRSVGAELPAAVESFLQRCCAKQPHARFEDMGTVMEHLEALRPQEVDPAPIATRAGAAAFDGLLTLLLVSAVYWPLRKLGHDLELREHGLEAFAFWHLLLVGVAESLWHQSPGKWMFEIGISDGEGLPPSRSARLLRYAVRYGPLLLGGLLAPLAPALGWAVCAMGLPVFVLAGIVAYVLTEGRTASDILTDTRVIYRLPAEERRRARRRARRAMQQRRQALAPAPAVDPDTATRPRVDPEA